MLVGLNQPAETFPRSKFCRVKKRKKNIISINRRNFLINTEIPAPPEPVSAFGQTSEPKPAKETLVDLQNWANVREQFDSISPDYIHLSSFFLASHPRPVREAIDGYRRAIDENPFLFVEHNIMEMPAKIQA